MVSSKFNEVDWSERDSQAANTYMTTKVKSKRIKSASQQRPRCDISITNQQQKPVTDSNFSASAKNIMAEHDIKTQTNPSPTMNKKGKYELAGQLDQLRREYEESARQLDDEDHTEKELNLQSNDPQEVLQESAFSNYKTQSHAISGHGHRKPPQQRW